MAINKMEREEAWSSNKVLQICLLITGNSLKQEDIF